MGLFVYYVYLAIISASVILGFSQFYQLSKPFKLLVFFLLITFISETMSLYFRQWIGYNTILYHIYIPIQLLFFGIFYSFMSKQLKPIYKNRYFLVALLFCILSILSSIFIESVKSMPTYSLLLVVLYIVPVVLLSYRKMLLSPNQNPILKQPLFWVNFGYLSFFTIAVFSLSFMIFAKYVNFIILPASIIFYSNILQYGVLFNAIRLEIKNETETYG